MKAKTVPAKNYFKVLKTIKSSNDLTCNLWSWLFKLRNTKVLTYEQFIILAEMYDTKTKCRTMSEASNDSIGQMEKEKVCREVFWL